MDSMFVFETNCIGSNPILTTKIGRLVEWFITPVLKTGGLGNWIRQFKSDIFLKFMEVPSWQRYTVLKTARSVKSRCAGWTPAISAMEKELIRDQQRLESVWVVNLAGDRDPLFPQNGRLSEWSIVSLC